MGTHGFRHAIDHRLALRRSGRARDAARLVWGRYFQELLAVARNHLSARIRCREDEEDVLQSMYKSFCSRQRRGDFDLASRDELWNLLVRITLRKARNTANRHLQGKRDVRREDPARRRIGRRWTRSHDPRPDRLDGPTPAEAALLNEALDDASRCSKTRPAADRLWKLEGYTNAEIAEAAGMHAPDR